MKPRQVCIAIAPNGGRHRKEDHAAIPLTADELALCAAECLEAGASMIHLHVRTADGGHLLDATAYKEAIARIREAVGDRLVVQITTEALGIYAPAEQIAVLKATRPEAATLALRELVPDADEELAFGDLLLWMKQERVRPQIILYDPGEAVRLAAMIRRGLVPWNDIPVLYVLGRYTAGQLSQPSELLQFLAPNMPSFPNWSVCAFGRQEAACVVTGALLGGHIRVGFENNFLLPNGETAPSNAALVRTVASALGELGYLPCDATAIRTLFDF
ncbi:beta-keto acid cleavage family enzyme [Devosia sp. A449]